MRFLPGYLKDSTVLLRLAALSCGIIMVGLFTVNFFRVLTSIGIVALFIVALFYRLTCSATYRSKFSAVYYSLLGVFGLVLLSGLQTQVGNAAEFWRGVTLQLPFLVLPLAFLWLPGLPGRYLVRLNVFFITLVTLSALGSAGYYLSHFVEINQRYLESQIMPTAPDHIRFSLMVTYAVAAATVLVGRKVVDGPWRRYLLVIIAFLVLYQHMLAVRSGLLTLYALAGVAIGWLLLWRRNVRLAGLIASLMLLTPMVSYGVFPTFRNKFLNTQDDVGRVRQSTSANNYSLVGRFYSYKVALEIFEEHPVLGVGRANMKPAIAQQYRQQFPSISEEAYILPHNQFLYYLVAYGGLGVLLFTLFFYFPGIRIWPHYSPLLLAQYLIITLSFLVEYTLEAQVGLTFALLFILLALNGQEMPVEPEQQWRPR
ncbi:O-antigen ligase family protein [Hymenobacter lutimineralis]|uniref:O-antigen ligase family protein n=1 Tax=Hymenobacter lutimineralis TaxID=2606448 RepID=A0A5D6VDG9_9BACT|nr:MULTISPECIES: O-antigen ligase family protein [Hymenobacter]QIX61099.1 O-antigen ligase family protein [Hymenobacter sp. BT18]TYZ13317.1 O-antigen ligase family protein [Hymenobacter lutimineralis]